MDGYLVLNSMLPQHMRPWNDCIPKDHLSLDNMPPFYVRLRDDQVGHLLDWLEDRRTMKPSQLFSSKFSSYWPWDFNTHWGIRQGRESWGTLYQGKGVHRTLDGGTRWPKYVDPKLPLTNTSSGKPMGNNPHLEKPSIYENGRKRKASETLEQQGDESEKKHCGSAGAETENELVQTSPGPHPPSGYQPGPSSSPHGICPHTSSPIESIASPPRLHRPPGYPPGRCKLPKGATIYTLPFFNAQADTSVTYQSPCAPIQSTDHLAGPPHTSAANEAPADSTANLKAAHNIQIEALEAIVITKYAEIATLKTAVQNLASKVKQEPNPVTEEFESMITRLQDILGQRTDRIQELQGANTEERRCIESLKVKLEAGVDAANPGMMDRVQNLLGQRTDRIEELQRVNTVNKHRIERLVVKLESGVGAADHEMINRLEGILDQRTDRIEELVSANAAHEIRIERLVVKLESDAGAADSETIDRLEDNLDQRTDQLQEVQSANSDKERYIEGLNIELESGAGAKDSETIPGLEEILRHRADKIEELQNVMTTEGLKQEDTSQEAQDVSDAGKDSVSHEILDLLSCLLGKRCPV